MFKDTYKCKKCGHEWESLIDNETYFCPHCGSKRIKNTTEKEEPINFQKEKVSKEDLKFKRKFEIELRKLKKKKDKEKYYYYLIKLDHITLMIFMVTVLFTVFSIMIVGGFNWINALTFILSIAFFSLAIISYRKESKIKKSIK